jgi:hypothetical protein
MTENQDKARLPIDHPFMTHDQARAAGQKIREDCVWPDQCHVLIRDCLGRAADPLGKDYCAEPASAHKAEEGRAMTTEEMGRFMLKCPKVESLDHLLDADPAPEPADKAGVSDEMPEGCEHAELTHPLTGIKIRLFTCGVCLRAAEAAARADGAREALKDAKRFTTVTEYEEELARAKRIGALEEREECAKAVCPMCRSGEDPLFAWAGQARAMCGPAIQRGPKDNWDHPFTHTVEEAYATCMASQIRARGGSQ